MPGCRRILNTDPGVASAFVAAGLGIAVDVGVAVPASSRRSRGHPVALPSASRVRQPRSTLATFWKVCSKVGADGLGSGTGTIWRPQLDDEVLDGAPGSEVLIQETGLGL
jgi:hypothetical protein